jgi:ABC-type multidrug transport system permease subunit
MTLRDRCEALPEAAKHFAKSFLMLLAAAITPWAVIGTCVWLFGTKNAIVPILLSMCAIGAGVMTATRVKL